MLVWSINLIVLSACILIVGMIKPGWLLFWMEKPSRMAIIIFSAFLFMAGVTMFGEANRQINEDKAKQNAKFLNKKSATEAEKPAVKEQKAVTAPSS